MADQKDESSKSAEQTQANNEKAAKDRAAQEMMNQSKPQADAGAKLDTDPTAPSAEEPEANKKETLQPEKKGEKKEKEKDDKESIWNQASATMMKNFLELASICREIGYKMYGAIGDKVRPGIEAAKDSFNAGLTKVEDRFDDAVNNIEDKMDVAEQKAATYVEEKWESVKKFFDEKADEVSQEIEMDEVTEMRDVVDMEVEEEEDMDKRMEGKPTPSPAAIIESLPQDAAVQKFDAAAKKVNEPTATPAQQPEGPSDQRGMKPNN